jgi:hypothetical protein
MKKTYEGGCHCKNVRYSVELDLDQPVIECNCSHCQIKGILWQFVPKASFTLLLGEDSLKEYLFNKKTIRHQFCTNCGVEPFAFNTAPDGTETAAINVRTIDDVDLAALTLTQANGKDF